MRKAWGFLLSGLLLTAVAQADVYIVTSGADSGAGSLREAVANAMLNTGVANSIVIQVPTVTLTSGLIEIDEPVFIDGLGATLTANSNDHPLLQLIEGSDGTSLTAIMFTGQGSGRGVELSPTGLQRVPDVRIANCAFTNFPFGVFAYHADRLQVHNCQLLSNGTGIWLDSCLNAQIGGRRSAREGNLISGNTTGIDIGGSDATGGGSKVQGNWIGLTGDGLHGLGNTGDGISNVTSMGNLFGGAEPDLRNVISGNTNGIFLKKNYGATIQGNYFGTNAAGTAVIANSASAIDCDIANGTLIGGPNTADGNLICGNASTGISFYHSGPIMTLENTGNVIRNNRFGVLANGQPSTEKLGLAIGLTSDAHQNTIGTKNGGPGNLIVGATEGIRIDGTGVSMNAIYGNTICAYGPSGTGIHLINNGNGSHPEPQIIFVNYLSVNGLATPGDYVEVFQSDGTENDSGGSLRLLGWGQADIRGQWIVSTPRLPQYSVVCATATDPAGSTSAFSKNQVLSLADPWVNANFNGQAALLYPNPADQLAKFIVHLDQPALVQIMLYNLNGERICTLSQNLPAGRGQTIDWNCASVAPGVYIGRILYDGVLQGKTKVCVRRQK